MQLYKGHYYIGLGTLLETAVGIWFVATSANAKRKSSKNIQKGHRPKGVLWFDEFKCYGVLQAKEEKDNADFNQFKV